MPIYLKESVSNFENPPAGLHPAVCYRLIDQGTQDYPYEGKSKIGRYWTLGWELVGEERQKDGKPFTIGKRWFNSGHEKARMRIDLESWRGAKFTSETIKTFDIEKIVGAKCMLNIQEFTKDDGSTGANISSIAPAMKGFDFPKATLPHEIFIMIDDNGGASKWFRPEVLEDYCGDKLREKIMGSPEYKRLTNPAAAAADVVAASSAAALKAAIMAEQGGAILQDEIPF
jgi:hypothetical protein